MIARDIQVDGPKPIIFSGWGEDVRYEQFLFGEANTPIEFGAEQGDFHFPLLL